MELLLALLFLILVVLWRVFLQFPGLVAHARAATGKQRRSVPDGLLSGTPRAGRRRSRPQVGRTERRC